MQGGVGACVYTLYIRVAILVCEVKIYVVYCVKHSAAGGGETHSHLGGATPVGSRHARKFRYYLKIIVDNRQLI